MAHPDWLGRQPERPYWSVDGESVYYQRKREGEETRDLYRIDLATGETSPVSDADRAGADAPVGAWDRERRRQAFVRAGDVFVRDLDDGGKLTQITRTAAVEESPFFTVGGDVAFRRAGVWFLRERATGLLRQPFDVREEEDPERARAGAGRRAPATWSASSRGLIEIVRQRRQREERSREVARERRAADSSRLAPPHYLGKEVEVAGAALSPALDRLVVRLRPKERDEGLRDTMPNYVTATGLVEVEEVRMKVGDGGGGRRDAAPAASRRA